VRAGRGVAVAGCSWHRWIEEISAVRMVVVGAWQWQYWPSNGRLKKGKGKCQKKGKCDTVAVQRHGQFDREWQWLGGSGTAG
jgi:hypothetical protein